MLTAKPRRSQRDAEHDRNLLDNPFSFAALCGLCDSAVNLQGARESAQVWSAVASAARHRYGWVPAVTIDEQRSSGRERKRRPSNASPKRNANAERRTSNIEHRTSNVEPKKIKERKTTPSVCSFRLFCWTFGVRCSMFDVRINLPM